MVDMYKLWYDIGWELHDVVIGKKVNKTSEWHHFHCNGIGYPSASVISVNHCELTLDVIIKDGSSAIAVPNRVVLCCIVNW